MTAGSSRPRPTAARTWAIIIIAAGVLLAGAGAWQIWGPTAAAEPGARQVNASQPEHAPAPPAGEPVALSIPSLGVESLAIVSGDSAAVADHPIALDDPGSLLWLSDRGLVGSGAESTAYLVGRTSENGAAALDPLRGDADGAGAALPGDEIHVETGDGVAVYEVLAVESSQADLASNETLWNEVPERLVVVASTAEAAPDSAEDQDHLILYARLIN